MKHKYVESLYPTWIEFGIGPNGVIDIATEKCDVATSIDKEQAERLMREHNRCIVALCELADAFDKTAPEAFKEYWYNRADHTDQEIYPVQE